MPPIYSEDLNSDEIRLHDQCKQHSSSPPWSLVVNHDMTVSIQRLNHWYQSTLFSTRSLNLHKSYPLPPLHHHFTSLWKHIYFPNPSFPGLFVFNLNFLAYLFAQVPFFFFFIWRWDLSEHTALKAEASSAPSSSAV